MNIKDGIILDMLPMPPSENEAYPTDFRTGRRFSGIEMKDFKARMQAWSIKPERCLKIAKIIDELKWELADHRKAIRVDTYMFFQYGSLFTTPVTKTERPRRKKMDPGNKAKPLYDCLASMLGVDDSRFIPGEVIPVLRTHPQGQYCMVRLSLAMIQTDEEFFQRMEVVQKI